MSDCNDLFTWRNHLDTRRNFKSSTPIEFDEHKKWLASCLQDANRILLIGTKDNAKIGTVRFDRQNRCDLSYSVSITVNPEFRGRGFGTALLKLACQHVAPCTLEAEIKAHNEASKRIFVSCGFAFVRRMVNEANEAYALYRADIKNPTADAI